ncbi:hypothetical protein [Sphingobacterium mizutaii]|nr:hypothetical protein [Sphingobacterium mizutaii]
MQSIPIHAFGTWKKLLGKATISIIDYPKIIIIRNHQNISF